MLIDWNKAAKAPSMRAGAVRRFATGQLTSVVWVDTEATAEFDGRPHRHGNEQWIVVLAGQLRVTCDDAELDLHAGDVVYVPANSWHAAVGVGPEGARYLELSAPPRLDLLPDSILPSALEFPRDEAGDRQRDQPKGTP